MSASLAPPGWRPVAAVGARALLGGLALLPLWSFAGLDVPLLAKLLVVGVLLASLFRPGAALLACAALLPLGHPVGRLLGSSLALTEPLVLAFLAGWLLRGAARAEGGAAGSESTCLVAAALFGAVVAASSTVQLTVLHVFVDYPWPYLQRLFSFLHTGYFRDRSLFQPLSDGMLALEGLALFWAAVVLTRRDGRLAPRLAGTIVAAAATVAALSLVQLLKASSPHEGEFLSTLALNLRTKRFAEGFKDFNAAGSVMALALTLAVGLIADARRGARAWLFPAAALLGGLWVSASRVAVVAAPLVIASVAARKALSKRSSRALRRPLLLVVLVVALLSAALAPLYVSRPILLEVGGRLEMARAAVKMTATAPAFGVGVGRFYALSPLFIGASLARSVPRENAHNNFLQVLAELGVVGLAAFLSIFWASGRAIMRGFSRSAEHPLLPWSLGGVAAFLLTCLTGHPLLVPEAASVFWLALGLTVALARQVEPPGEEEPASRGPRRGLIGAWMLAAAIACSVPLRANHQLARTDLATAGMGLSTPRVDPSGVRFRWMLRQARIYVPANARQVVVPLKLPTGVADVRVLVRGRVAAEVTVDGAHWREVRFQLPPAGRRGFVGVDIRLGALHQRPDEDGGGTLGAARVQVGWPRVVQ